MTTPRGRSTERKSVEDRLSELESHRELWCDPKLESLEKKVDALEAFQRWVLGAAVAIGAGLGFFAGPIKKFLGMG